MLKKLGLLFLAFFFGLAIALFIFKLTVVEIPVFGFHDIIDLENPAEIPPQRPSVDGDYSKQELENFIEHLVRENYWFLSTQDLDLYFLSDRKKTIPEERRKQHPILLSFDDGYTSAHKNILAILENIEKKYQQKIKVVWFINPAFMGRPGSQLDHASCKDLRLGLKKGYYDLQSHGLTHHNLTDLSTEKLTFELSESQRMLRECTQDLDSDKIVATHLSYPFGAVNKTVEQATAKYYQAAYLYNSRILRPASLKNKYQIPRLTIYTGTPLSKLKILAAGGWL